MGFLDSLFGGYQRQVDNFLNQQDGLSLTEKTSTLIAHTLRTFPNDYSGEKMDIVRDTIKQRDVSGELYVLVGAAPLSQFTPMIMHKRPEETKWNLAYITDGRYTESTVEFRFLRYRSPSNGAIAWIRAYDSGKPTTDLHLKLYPDFIEAPLPNG